ncbi:MAG: TlpA disulfide reductase family protein [bacterium]|jgi:thiol-disulfide isomerase/thioredoxin
MNPLNRRQFLLAIGAGTAAAPALRAAQVPRPAPELAVRLVNGQQLLLSQFKGKVIALEFLQTTCPHCQTASTVLEKLYREYGPKGFQPVGVAFNDMAALLVPDFIARVGATFPIGIGARDEVLTYIQHPPDQVLYVPQLLFIDKKFVIRGQYGGLDTDFFKDEEKNMRNIIEMLLKESAAPARKTAAKKAKK